MSNHDRARIVGPFVLLLTAVAVVVWIVRAIFVPEPPRFPDEAHQESDRSGEQHPE